MVVKVMKAVELELQCVINMKVLVDNYSMLTKVG